MTKQILPMVLGTLLVSAWSLADAQSIVSSPESPVTAVPLGAVPAADVPAPAATQEQIIYAQSDAPVMNPMMQVNSADDADYFVLSIPPVPEELEAKVDVVILCDTSASMNGAFRDDQMTALQLVTGSLGAEDRVKILACDLNAIPMTNGFAGAASSDVENAITKLQARTPLGSMDIAKALQAAVESFDAASDAAKVIVFIGQGSSRANLMLPNEFAALADSLAKNRVSVDSVAVGPNVDVVLLKTLAAKTGGMVVANEDPNFGDLPGMIRRKVAWTAGEASHSFTALYPIQIPPLRSDRETIVIGKADKGVGASTLKFSLENGSSLSFNFRPEAAAGSFIRDMVGKVEKNNGWLPLEKWSDVMNVVQNVEQHTDSMIAMAKGLLDGKTFELDQAEALVKEAAAKAPNNPEVQEMVELIGELRARQAGDITEFMNPGGNELQAELMAEDVNTQRERVIVQEAINKAREAMAENPMEAIDILSAELAKISALGLPSEVQDTLTRQIQSSIREAKSREEARSIKKAEERTRLTEMRERQIALDNAKTEQQNMMQMMRRFDSLMDEGKYREAEESAAAAVLEKDPENVAAIAGTITARHRGYIERNRQLVVQRQKGFVDALYQSELGSVPFPDDPPVVYPDSEVWKRMTDRRVEKYSSMDLAQSSQAEKQLNEALAKPTQISEVETPLPMVIDKLKDQHQIGIQLDTAALEEERLDPELPITLDVNGISLGAALRLMLTSNDMMFVIEDEVLKITTATRAEESQSTRVYPVADIVIPIQNMPPMNGGMGGGMLGNNGSGGMSGGFGGMMGGAGMGMGGGGMGMGGMGMGGGMGGFMNSGEALKRAAAINKATGGAFFNAKEEVRQAGNANSMKKSVKKASPAKWNKYFRQLENADEAVVTDSQAKVREVVRQLRKERRFDEIITILEAAILNDQVQPWMYETLAIAMVMDKRPAEDVERAYLSALEFCEDPNQMLLIGTFMENLNFHDRALKIYQELGKLFPESPEPFVFALNLARRPDVDNLEMIQWASLGLLRLEVSADRKPDWDSALLSAKAVAARLDAEGKAEDAKAFEQEMELALQRDCVVNVSWTGDADIDLFVEEPNGSLCSMRNQRSAGGGFITADGFTKNEGRDASSKAVETYVCSEGFAGTYRVFAKRIWGEVTGNKVIVEGTIHYGTGESKTIKMAIPLENDACCVEFALDKGRRTESLEVAKMNTTIAKAKEAQISQKLFQNIDQHAMASYGSSDSSKWAPYFQSDAVGYMPVIWTLQPGATYGATGVVSADRRYVRISVAPTFSSIGKVTVFNYVTGEGNSYDGNEGMGGGNNNN